MRFDDIHIYKGLRERSQNRFTRVNGQIKQFRSDLLRRLRKSAEHSIRFDVIRKIGKVRIRNRHCSAAAENLPQFRTPFAARDLAPCSFGSLFPRSLPFHYFSITPHATLSPELP